MRAMEILDTLVDPSHVREEISRMAQHLVAYRTAPAPPCSLVHTAAFRAVDGTAIAAGPVAAVISVEDPCNTHQLFHGIETLEVCGWSGPCHALAGK
mmetsp:Transcript_5446/g.13133  ORF Transcript_5446/g.13133 Transcript_5446/m.13133 type:complete len:97 (+) Transcript_5446:159-449(+)